MYRSTKRTNGNACHVRCRLRSLPSTKAAGRRQLFERQVRVSCCSKVPIATWETWFRKKQPEFGFCQRRVLLSETIPSCPTRGLQRMPLRCPLLPFRPTPAQTCPDASLFPAERQDCRHNSDCSNWARCVFRLCSMSLDGVPVKESKNRGLTLQSTFGHPPLTTPTRNSRLELKSQGQTMECVIVDLASEPPSGTLTAFDTYVALSRSRGR